MLSPRPTPKLEDDVLSAVRDHLFNIFTYNVHIGRSFLHPQPEGSAMMWWQGPSCWKQHKYNIIIPKT